MNALILSDHYLLLSLADHQGAFLETKRHGGSPQQYMRCLNSAGRWAVYGSQHSPLVVWRPGQAGVAQAAAERSSKARGRLVTVVTRMDSSWAEGREIQIFTDALAPALDGHTAHSEGRACRLHIEAEKLAAFSLIVQAAAGATSQEAFAEVSRAASKAMRAKFGGGSISSACAWLTGRAGRDALGSFLAGEVETGSLSVQQVVEAVELARNIERLQNKT